MVAASQILNTRRITVSLASVFRHLMRFLNLYCLVGAESSEEKGRSSPGVVWPVFPEFRDAVCAVFVAVLCAVCAG